LVARYLSGNAPSLALAVISEAPEYQKRDVRWMIGYTWALLANSKLPEAKGMLDKALAQGRPPEAVFQSAVLAFVQRDYAGARQPLDELLIRGIDDLNVVDLLMKTYTAQNQTAKGIERLAEVAAKRPDSAKLQHVLGKWYLQAGRAREAQKAFEAAKAADPRFIPADLSLAEGDLNAGRNDDARQRLSKVAAENPQNVPTLLLAARADEQAGDGEAAILRYRAVLSVDSTNLVALNNLAYALAAESPDEALKFGQQALEKAPDSPNVQDTLGWIYYRKQLYPMAIDVLKKAAAKDASPQRLFHLGMAYVRSGDRTLGQKMVQDALQKEPQLVRTEHGW
jgi:tetratricopeptide (TPR) repeat protein